MTTPETAAFSFANFKISKSDFDFSLERGVNLNISFNLSGQHFVKTNVFKLIIETLVNNHKEEIVIRILSESIFNFTGIEDKDLMNYFVGNAPAIVFPYIRAYVGTLTTLSGYPPLLLPTLNLSKLSKDLEQNITQITE
jgi:preprotein translocase subunit SecB